MHHSSSKKTHHDARFFQEPLRNPHGTGASHSVIILDCRGTGRQTHCLRPLASRLSVLSARALYNLYCTPRLPTHSGQATPTVLRSARSSNTLWPGYTNSPPLCSKARAPGTSVRTAVTTSNRTFATGSERAPHGPCPTGAVPAPLGPASAVCCLWHPERAVAAGQRSRAAASPRRGWPARPQPWARRRPRPVLESRCPAAPTPVLAGTAVPVSVPTDTYGTTTNLVG